MSSGLAFWNGDDMYVSQTAISIPLFSPESLVASLLGTSFGYRVEELAAGRRGFMARFFALSRLLAGRQAMYLLWTTTVDLCDGGISLV